MTRRSRTSATGCSEIGERDTQVQLLRRGDACAGADLQGPQVVPHARRPGLHGALDPLRRDAAGADRGDRRAAARRPRSDPAGDEAEPGLLQDDLRRPAQHQEDAKNVQAALDGDRRLPGRAHGDAVRAGDRSPARSRRSAVVLPRSRTISSGTSTSSGVTGGVRVSGRPGAHRQGVHCRCSSPGRATSKCRNWPFSTSRERSDGF